MKASHLFLTILLFLFFSCKEKKKDYFDFISVNDVKLSEPKPGEWRETREEKFQTYEDFLNAKKIFPSKEKNTIYLLPIGNFSDLEKNEIENTREYLQNYFQLKTIILPTISESSVPKSARRTIDSHEQLLAGYILNNILIKNKPKDAVVLMAITQKDLFPKPEWNYVFGLASYQNGVGVTSMYRFHDGNLNKENFNTSLLRLAKISSHEIGHMFGLNHCLNAICVMNGTNNLTETDEHFARLCSLCQKKLNYSLKYDNMKRLIEVNFFFQKMGYQFETELSLKDLNALK